MTEQNPRAVIGANNPPDPIDTLSEPYDAARMESESWLDGTPVTNEGQMNAVDWLRKEMRDWRLGLEKGQKEATAPLHLAYKIELDRWKPIIEDAKRIEAGLVATTDTFKRKLAEEKEAARKEAERLAWETTRSAQEAARQADASNIEAQRAVADKMAEAQAAQKLAMAAKADTVKGLRSVTRTVVIDELQLARWLWSNDRDAVLAFNAERARKLALNMPGIAEQVTTKEAY